eukprot:Hpha_TRINITY_DN36_c0_g1::TRINITY_DN36_c0_g1_i1::g.110073::m.110073
MAHVAQVARGVVQVERCGVELTENGGVGDVEAHVLDYDTDEPLLLRRVQHPQQPHQHPPLRVRRHGYAEVIQCRVDLPHRQSPLVVRKCPPPVAQHAKHHVREVRRVLPRVFRGVFPTQQTHRVRRVFRNPQEVNVVLSYLRLLQPVIATLRIEVRYCQPHEGKEVHRAAVPFDCGLQRGPQLLEGRETVLGSAECEEVVEQAAHAAEWVAPAYVDQSAAPGGGLERARLGGRSVKPSGLRWRRARPECCGGLECRGGLHWRRPKHGGIVGPFSLLLHREERLGLPIVGKLEQPLHHPLSHRRPRECQ